MNIGFDGLKKGGLILGVLFLIFVGLYALGMIGGLVVGSISKTATSGTVSVSSAMNTSIAGLETDYITDSGKLFDNVALIVGLIAIVVIVSVFGFKFNFGGGKGVN